MRKMCKDCLHFDHCVNIPNYPVTENTIACDDWDSKDKYVPVVRCKDCKHNMTEVYSTEYGRFIACEIFSKRHSFDDFCSYGERKDGDV